MSRQKVFTFILHIAGWSIFLMLPLLFMSEERNGNGMDVFYSLPYLRFCVCYISLFYINSLYLIPDFFIRKKYLKYFFYVSILFVGVFYLKPFDRLMNSADRRTGAFIGRNVMPHHMDGHPGFDRPAPGSGENKFPPGPPPFGQERNPRRIDINSLLIFILIMAFSMALRSIRQWQITEKRALLAEADKAVAELSFLKAQINPHFLYNTLNNIYTLSIIGSDRTSESIMKLSDIMRYVTDEAEADFVSLVSELNCISNFIDLQKLRLGKMVKLHYSIEGDASGHRICPLLLMTFIENVFKYGLSNHVPALIDIIITIEKDQIIFHSRNTIFDKQKQAGRTGIGLVNTRKRLDFLYPGKYKLDIDQADQIFTVDLVLHS